MGRGIKMQAAQTRVAAQAGPAVLRPRELRRLLAAPDGRTRRGKRDRALLAVLSCGLRVGEGTRLAVSQIEQNSGRVRLIVKTSKSHGQWRTVTMPALAAKALREHLAHADPRLFVFEGQRHEALTVRQAQRITCRYLRAIGRGDLHTHSLRHTFGAMVTRETCSIYVAQRLLGHADPRTTARYYSAFEVSDADAAADAVAEALSRRGRKA
jgi:integrase/recombinase XerD